ncbi:unnamed protein product [Schistosoma margrebowiei]|uniref:Uncharacterized protein n=1 Tax=Schistosoma margrebowiei TaxID=48269 RepID=A0A3P7XSY0_9TREM|nr:unnamed protein product [Schistosoma margrebowiei]
MYDVPYQQFLLVMVLPSKEKSNIHIDQWLQYLNIVIFMLL